MKRCVIVGNANISNYTLIKEYLNDDDFIVYCDGGLKHLQGLDRIPDLIVGDFDSIDNPHMDVETIVLPCEKDDTDTVYAVKECIKRGFDEFVLMGVVGERLDHTLGNVYILVSLYEKGLHGLILDDYSEMCLVSDNGEYVEDKYSYFSIIALSDEVTGIDEVDAKYPLSNASIKSGYQYGISNEVLPGKKSFIKKKSGNLLLIKVF